MKLVIGSIESDPTSSAVSSSGTEAAGVSLVSGSRDKTVRVWDPMRGQCLSIFTAHENWVRGALFDPTGRYVISCSDDKSIRVFDLKEERCLRAIEDAHGHFVSCISSSDTRPIFFTGSVDKSVALWSC